MKTQRNFWPLGITLGAMLCVSFYATFVVIACRHKSELVSSDYYDQEIKYQSRIDSQVRTGQLATKASAHYDEATKRVVIALPAEHIGKALSGEIVLFRPSEAGQDRTFAFAPDKGGTQSFEVGELPEGLYRLRFSWKVDDADFSFDERIVIGPAAMQAKLAALTKPHGLNSSSNHN